ncbi:MAG: MerR family DNA-binding transcriptional regulator [Phenylobacterium sp.]|jgi:DNA-binding transcriptional MerR regulator|uniref:MerR family transcriptional regulator n=1 Tax=Phenylobacterium sp. TaxID=1871053 RepID=UPI002A279D28|nr:MerR family DNA-binding transcriptional regulator [Phenylobacterium sp.]MDD3838202.1 MerR family DNA-binding transcriptional regulator [Phenylobacterium sp.]MDX9996360.1 MerR family DNA-binding transcriptional regulator [Phenylobacterium sp.]
MTFSFRRPPFRTYSISELCREFDVTPRALRFYEERGLLSPARRDMQRIYSSRDRARLALVVRGRRVGISLAEIHEILDVYDREGPAGQNARALRVFKKKIAELEAQRADVVAAIETLQDAADRLAERLGGEAAA